MEEESIGIEYEEAIIPKTFFWMFLGLLGTALISWYSYSSGFVERLIANGFFEVMIIVELIVVLLFSFLFKKLPAVVAGIFFFIYAMINGITLSMIYYVFYMDSIMMIFAIAAVTFGVMALIGYKTKKDISGWRTILMGLLLAGIVSGIINLFLKNTMLEIVIDWVVLITFFAITMYDMNKIKMLASDGRMDKSKIHIYGAMILYLDFINIFLRLLSLFGRRRN